MPFKNSRNSRDDKSKKEDSKSGKASRERSASQGKNTGFTSTSKRPYGTYTPKDEEKKSSDERKSYSKDRPNFGKNNHTAKDKKFSGSRSFKPEDKSSAEDRSFKKDKNSFQDKFGKDSNSKNPTSFSNSSRNSKSFSNKTFSDREKPAFKRPSSSEDEFELKPAKKENFSRPYEKTYEKRVNRSTTENADTNPEQVKLRSRSANKPSAKKDGDLIRLNRFIANAGICSRRKADELIEAGVISVNGEVISELGAKINPGKDQIRYNGQLLKSEKMIYVLLNKPKDFITTTEDPQERKTVMALVDKASKERIYPVGRLDRNTTGLLLLTNDGDLAEKLSHPRNSISKIYHVELNRNLTQGDFNKIAFGLELEDGFIKPDSVSYVAGGSKSEIGIQIHSGKNRIVRRIFESLNYEVVKLDRVIYANLSKKDLPRGKWRHLTEKEIIQLKHFIK